MFLSHDQAKQGILIKSHQKTDYQSEICKIKSLILEERERD